MAGSEQPTGATADAAPAEAPAPEQPAAAAPGSSRDANSRIQALTTSLRAADAVIEELKGRDLQAQVADLQGQLATQTTAAAGWDAEKTAWAAERSAWDDQRSLLTAGIVDVEGQAVAQALYGIQPEAERGTLAEWLGGMNGTAPPALQPYLRAAAPAPAAAQAPAAALVPPPGKPSQPVVQATPTQLADLERRMWASKGRQFEALRDQLAKLTGRS